jgi:hypothetical protein
LPSRRALTALAAVALLAASCVDQAKPGVQVKALQADLVFGVKPLAKAVPPANLGIAAPPPLPMPPLAPIMPDLSFPSYLAPLPTAQACPKAGISSFPKEAAALNVAADRRPAVGSYRWTRSGTRQGPDTLGLTLPVGGFEQRLVRNVVKTSATQFSFETVQTDIATRETVITTWQVKTNGTTTTGTVSPPSPAPVPPSAGDPERGVVIKKIVRTDAKGAVTNTFAPQLGLLVLPLPARIGENFTSSAVDPLTFQTLQFQGTVQAPARLDACGEIVEAWPVQGTETFTGTTTTTANYTAFIAPQMGGMLVGETVDQTAATGFLKVRWTIGQLTPSPAAAAKASS